MRGLITITFNKNVVRLNRAHGFRGVNMGVSYSCLVI